MFDDPVRLKTVAWLVPDARAAFSLLLQHATSAGYLPSIVSAVRTCAEETNLASNTSGKVKRSWHVLGRAVDIELHLGAPADDPAKFYRELGAWWRSIGGTWGGDWQTSFQPLPGVTTDVMHFQWTPNMGDSPRPSEWPDGLTCEQVDALQIAVLGADPKLRIPPGSSSPSSTPAPATPQKKSPLPSLQQAHFFFLLGVHLRQRDSLSGPRAVAVGGP